MDVSRLAGDGVDVGTGFIADIGDGSDVDSAAGKRSFRFDESGGDDGGADGTNGDIGFRIDESEIGEDKFGEFVFFRVDGHLHHDAAAIEIGGERGGDLFLGEAFGADGEPVLFSVGFVFGSGGAWGRAIVVLGGLVGGLVHVLGLGWRGRREGTGWERETARTAARLCESSGTP